MAKRKTATDVTNKGPGQEERPGDAGDAGGSDAGAGASLAVRLLIRDLRAIEKDYVSPMDPELGTLVALYARTLSAIDKQAKGNGKGDLGDKTTDELLEMAMNVPELRDRIKAFRGE